MKTTRALTLVCLPLLFLAGCTVKLSETPPAAARPQAAPADIPAINEAAPPTEAIEPVQSAGENAGELTDDELLESVQRQTFRYFWDLAHPVSGMALERNRPGETGPTMAAISADRFFPDQGSPGEHGLRAEYFDNKELAGAPVLTRVDPRVDFDWGLGRPADGLPADGFSVRWTGRWSPSEGGEHEYGLGSDDGSRLYLNGQLVINNWGDHGPVVERKTLGLEAGSFYDLRIEYYDSEKAAQIRFGQIGGGTDPNEPAQAQKADEGNEVCATGGSGFGIMSILVAAERKWITREQAVGRLLKILNFLQKADRFHGAFPHWLNGDTAKTIPFTPQDDGGDLVETSFLMEGLLCARQYFDAPNAAESQIRDRVTTLWNSVEWDWYTQGGRKILYWHWSPKHQWGMNHGIGGWNECLITYLLAASSPTHAIDAAVYHEGWARNGGIRNGREYYGIKLPLGMDYGGPLFFAHYSFQGLDPRGLKDRYADYWEQNVAHTLINRAYCLENPKQYKGYGENCWGLTASDNHRGYAAHSPTEDLGVISPTAALSSFPYAPGPSLAALKHFYYDLGGKIWGHYGFVDAFSETHDWYARTYLAIDQGPIIVMMENHRSGLMWNLFMSVPEVQAGLKKLGFESPHLK